MRILRIICAALTVALALSLAVGGVVATSFESQLDQGVPIVGPAILAVSVLVIVASVRLALAYYRGRPPLRWTRVVVGLAGAAVLVGFAYGIFEEGLRTPRQLVMLALAFPAIIAAWPTKT